MTDKPRIKPVMNLDEVTLEERPAFFHPPAGVADRFGSRTGPVGARIGARLLGYSITVVAPGKRAFSPAQPPRQRGNVLHPAGQWRVAHRR